MNLSDFLVFQGEYLYGRNGELIIKNARIQEVKEKIKELDISLIFWNCIFETSVDFNGMSVLAEIMFGDCTFHGFVLGRGATFEKKLVFNGCIFKEKVDFSKPHGMDECTTFKGETSFVHSTFESDVNFSDTKFSCSNISTEYDNMVEVNFSNILFAREVSFARSIFDGRVCFECTIFKGNVNFAKARFLCEMSECRLIENIFRECLFGGITSFEQCHFNGRVNFKATRFMSECRFVATEFLSPLQKDTEDPNQYKYENSFRESFFYDRISFEKSIFKGRVDFSYAYFGNITRFNQCKFNAEVNANSKVENCFLGCIYEKQLTFDKATFNGRVNFVNNQFRGEVYFAETTFNGTFVDFQESSFYESTFFANIKNYSKIIFIYVRFLKYVRFLNFSFQNQLDFNECILENAHFIDLHSTVDAYFKKCILKNNLFANENVKNPMFKNIVFENCVFKETNTFGKNVFSQKIKPLLTTNTFEGQFNIDQDFLRYEYEDILTKDPTLWRDLFRRLKSNRLAYHNVIDASELHTQELYARELEIENQKNSKIKEKVEKWQLWFYRNTSDHHTNLGKIFCNVILLIALFGVFALFLNEIKTVFPIDKSIATQCSYKETLQQWYWGIFQSFNLKINGTFILVICSVLTLSLIGHAVEWIYHSKSLYAKETTKNIIGLVVYLILSGISVYGNTYLAEYFKHFSEPYLEAYAIFLLCLSFILVYLGLMLTRGFVLTALSCVICACILIFKPSLLLPFVGQLFDEGLKANFPAMQSLSVVYCILMFLMLFSLQKTARKNSIIPS